MEQIRNRIKKIYQYSEREAFQEVKREAEQFVDELYDSDVFEYIYDIDIEKEMLIDGQEPVRWLLTQLFVRCLKEDDLEKIYRFEECFKKLNNWVEISYEENTFVGVAIEFKAIKIANYMLDNDYPLYYYYFIKDIEYRRGYPVLASIISGNSDLLKKVIEKGGDFNERISGDDDLFTAWGYLIRHNFDYKIAELLLDKGIEPCNPGDFFDDECTLEVLYNSDSVVNKKDIISWLRNRKCKGCSGCIWGKERIDMSREERYLHFMGAWSCEQHSKHHIYSVGEHTEKVVEYCKQHGASDELIRAAWLHDAGKIVTKMFDGEYDHFTGHPGESAKIAEDLRESEYVVALIKYHDSHRDDDIKLGELVKYGRKWCEELKLLFEADLFAQNPDFMMEEKKKSRKIFVDKLFEELDRYEACSVSLLYEYLAEKNNFG